MSKSQIRLAVLAVALLMCIAPANAEWKSSMGKCLLEIDGSRLIDGTCRIEVFLEDPKTHKSDLDWRPGTFSIETRENGDLLYSAFVEVIGPGRAAAWWSEEKGQRQAQQDPQGVLTRKGACWTNERVQICAWK